MILTADNCEKFISTIESLDGLDPFACRIISLCTSYQPVLPFVDYWTVFDDKTKNPTGAIARNGTDFILFLTDKSDINTISIYSDTKNHKVLYLYAKRNYLKAIT